MRRFLKIVWVLPSLLGVALQYGTSNTGSRLFGYYIIGSFVGSVGQGFAFPGANVTGYTYVKAWMRLGPWADYSSLFSLSRKRITVGGMIFVAYAVGNLIGRRF